MEKEIKDLRIRIDELSQLVKELTISKETDKCYDSLILAKAWLGKVLGQLQDDTTPYKNDGKRKTVEDIEPTADVADRFVSISKDDKTGWKIGDKEYLNHIEKVDWLREEIKKIELLPEHPKGTWSVWSYSWNEARKYLIEARFWLGFELGRIRDEALKK